MNDHVANDELYKRASYLMWKERWAEAAKLLKPKCAQEKGDWRWCWNLGWCYFKLGKLEFAEKYLIRATQVSPNNASCKWALGTVYLKQKRYRKAERVLAESPRRRTCTTRHSNSRSSIDATRRQRNQATTLKICRLLKHSTGSTLSFGFEDNEVVLVATQTKSNTKFFVEPSLRDAGAIQFAVP
jgi:tetratricopeptide (TPR) repeat protein